MHHDGFISMRERTVASSGVEIHVVEEGPEDGAPVLFLHGFPEFWWSWRHQMEALARDGYRAVAMDLRGFGGSGKPDEVGAYALPNSLGDVTAVLDALGPRAALVSHDWGGALGWVYAALFPDRVDRLVVMNSPHPSAFRDRVHHLRQLQLSWYMLFFQFEGVAEEALERNDFELFREWFYGTATVPLAASDVARYVEVFSAPGALRAGLNWYRANVPPQSFAAEAAGELPRIVVPTMLVWGLDDAYLSFDLGRRAGEFVDAPFALHALADTGHWVQQERPEETNDLLLTFLGTRFP